MAPTGLAIPRSEPRQCRVRDAICCRFSFLRYHVIVTTYNIVGIEGGTCPDAGAAEAAPKKATAMKRKRRAAVCTLFEVYWRRVILDEAHVIRNHKTALSTGACKLKAGE